MQFEEGQGQPEESDDMYGAEPAERHEAARRPYNASFRLAKYVRACALNPDPDKPQARFYAWLPGEPWKGIIRGLFFCKSWRCEWGCAEHEAHVLFARMKEAFAPYASHELVFVVLTLDSQFHRMDFKLLDELYEDLRARFESFRKRLRRWIFREFGESFGNRWVVTIEQHETGVPHINFVFVAPKFSSWLESRRLERRRNGQTERTAKLLANTQERRDDIDRELYAILQGAGFGFASSAEQGRDKDKIIGYTAAVARHADATAGKLKKRFVRKDDGSRPDTKSRRRRRRRRHNPLRLLGELAKKRQLPTRAPKGFRRVRAGVRFLPPRQKGHHTGCILSHNHTDTGYELVRAMTKTKDPERARVVAMCEEMDRTRVWEERAKRESGEAERTLKAEIEHQKRELAIWAAAPRTDPVAQKHYLEAKRQLTSLRRHQRRAGVERVAVPAELLERFQCGPPRAPPETGPPPGDPPRPAFTSQRLPGMA